MTTAALHYAHGFSSAFASFSSQPAAAAAASAANTPLYNYACLLAAAAAAYATARTAARYAAAVLPPTVKSSAAARRGALALCLPATALICYVAAGYPPLGGSVAVKWVAGNWERNGERDLQWCGRLFALLFFWQALLAGGIAALRALAGGVSGLVVAASGGAGSSSKAGKKLAVEQQPRQGRNTSVSVSSSGKGDGVGGRDKARPRSGENGAPGWETESKKEVPSKA